MFARCRVLIFAGLAGLALSGCRPATNPPLWPGSKYTERNRTGAIERALAFIEQSAAIPANFSDYGSDYLYCFDSIAASGDPQLRAAAGRMGRRAAARWARTHSIVSAGASADGVADMVFGWLAASQLGQSDARVKPELRRAAARFTAQDYLLFDPAKEAPPSDIPEECKRDSFQNARGAKVCAKCGRPLRMRSRYSIWEDALITSYTGDRYGIQLGAPYREVLQWLPQMHPYLDRRQTTYPVFLDTIYSVTHVIYTLNDYGQHLLRRELLPDEYFYLRRNLREAIELHDPETTGEFLDSLKSFGLNTSDEAIRTGIAYLLDTQRADGTWSAATEKDAYTLYHSAWTGIDGLKDCRWRGEGLSFPELLPMLERMQRQR
ncbi:MAG TPA: hypothetical protein VKX49_19190 [Bryobacteraceae bacterium]|nr:hypothetical protein [Bryobacteraceae bacterium]